MANYKIVWVDNVGLPIEMYRMINPIIVACVANGEPLPDDLADVFSLEIVNVDGAPRGILRFA